MMLISSRSFRWLAVSLHRARKATMAQIDTHGPFTYTESLRLPRGFEQMHMLSLAKRVALGAVAATLFVVAASAQSPTASPLPRPVLGPANESNHFIETPKGWVHP